ncbi:MAG TPA: ATP-binding protein [Myxococcota bacterium]|nr:ATP-binding protein [Myxococcota bacterium]
MVAAAISVFVSQAVAKREREQFALLVETSARKLRAEISAELDARMHSISILAREWQDRLLPRRGDWESDVRLILSQSPGLQSVAWVDAAGEHSWAYPPEAEMPAVDVDKLRAGGIALRRAVVIGPVVPRDGEPRLRILAPLRDRGSLSGWLAATYASRELFNEILASVDSTFTVNIAAGEVDLYRAPTAGPGDPLRPVSHQVLALPGGPTIQILVEPSDEMVTAARSQLPLATLAGGLALSALVAIALFLRNVAAERARALEAEVAGHTRAESEVRRLNAELEERVRERTAALVHSNDELQKFASFVSHELRQPLGTQMIWIELLESQAGRRLDDASRKHLANIRAMTLKMSDLISAQVALSAQPHAKAPTDRVDLAAVVRDALTEFSHRIDGVGAKVKVGPLPIVLGEVPQLTQLFRNLFDNALKYRRDGVQAEIRVSAQAAEDPGLRGGIEILVEDNGRGFAREDAERIFQPHEQLDPAGDGQGIGLALCRTIAERHGGRLGAEGRLGEGATFRIWIPEERIYR